jgi:hypothetical protein
MTGKFSFLSRSFAASGRSRAACSRWRSPRLAPRWTRWRCPACARAPTPTAVPNTTWTWVLSLVAYTRTMLCAPTAATACDMLARMRVGMFKTQNSCCDFLTPLVSCPALSLTLPPPSPFTILYYSPKENIIHRGQSRYLCCPRNQVGHSNFGMLSFWRFQIFIKNGIFFSLAIHF